MFNSKRNFYLFLGLIVVMGVSAGIFGGVISRNYLNPGGNIFGNQDLDLNSYNNSNLIIRDAKNVVVNSDLKVLETYNSVQTSLVKVFKKQAANPKVKKVLYYDLDQALADGFIMSSDGWVVLNVAPTDLEKNGFKKEVLSSFLALGVDKKEYVIDQLLYNKNISNTWAFIHLKNVNNLTVRKILDARALEAGQSLLVMNGRASILPSYLVNKNWPQLVRSSDRNNEELVLANTLSGDFKNSYIFGLNGDLLAYVDSNLKIKSAQEIDLGWHALMKTKTISAASLGLYYLDLNKVKLVAGAVDYGALISANDAGLAFDPTSPAEKAGLKIGDIILRLDSQELKGNLGLAEALATYQAGDLVTFTYLRDGQEKDIDIKLSELK